MKRCHHCGQEWESLKKQPGVKETCEGCSAYLHCCLNCRHYRPSMHNQCYIPTTDWVGDKTGLNFCDEFDFADQRDADAEDTQDGQARKALSQLFGEKEEKGGSDAPLDKFKQIFGE